MALDRAVQSAPATDPDDRIELEHTRIDTNGVELHAVVAGPEDGPLVVLLHGFPEFWYAWRGQFTGLVDAGYRVIAPDQRGYNTSDKPRAVGAYGLDDLRDDVLGVLANTRQDRAFLVGHDWGGIVAWYLAMTCPDRVRRLAVVNAPHPVAYTKLVTQDPRQVGRSWYAVAFQLPWLPERLLGVNGGVALLWLLRATSVPGTFSVADRARYRMAYARPGALRGMLSWYRAALRHRPTPSAGPRIDPPTLLIWGELDAGLRTTLAARSVALCAHGRLERFPHATHWVIHERPDRVTALILEHFARAR